MLAKRNNPTFKSQLLTLTMFLLLSLGTTLVITLSLVSGSVIKSEIPLFYLEPDEDTVIIDNDFSGKHNPDMPFSTESVQHNIVNRLQLKLLRWFFIITAGFIIAFLFGMSWISRLITEPITKLTNVISDPQPLNSMKLSAPKHIEIANLQEAALTKIKQLEDLILQQEEFALNTTHEFRSPVAAIRMNLDLILQEKAAYTSELLDSLVSIDNSTIRLESLIKQYGFYLYKDQIYRPEMIELNALLQECIKILHEKAKDKGITISYDTNQMSTVFSDRAILQTILINLLDNAIKYNRQAGKVSIKTWAHQNGYEFSVEDNGIGISQEELPYIFDRFYRVDTSRSRKTGGSGLGLSIVKTLVKSASGTISIHSDIDKGTIVRFYIPNKDTIAV